MLLKICDRCGRRYDATLGTCQCGKKRHEAYDKTKRDRKSYAVYHDKAWTRLVIQCKDRCCGLDMYKLMVTGQPVPARKGTVHHIIEVGEDMGRAFDIDNLIYVGAASHNVIHAIYDKNPDEKLKLQKQLRECLHRFTGGGSKSF